jgi:hypothetical protein
MKMLINEPINEKPINEKFDNFDLEYYDLNDLDFCILASICGCCIKEVYEKYKLPLIKFGYYENILKLMYVLGVSRIDHEALLDIIRMLKQIDLIWPLSFGIAPKVVNNPIAYKPIWSELAVIGVSNKSIKRLFGL